MEFVMFNFVFNLIIPAIMLFFGMKFRKHAPKNINAIYGYRTPRSMKNKDTWEFAHQYCGRLWIKIGFIMFIISIISSLVASAYDENAQGITNLILITMQTVTVVISIFPVEQVLKKNFDENGNKLNKKIK